MILFSVDKKIHAMFLAFKKVKGCWHPYKPMLVYAVYTVLNKILSFSLGKNKCTQMYLMTQLTTD
jgi:hypothetical protein